RASGTPPARAHPSNERCLRRLPGGRTTALTDLAWPTPRRLAPRRHYLPPVNSHGQAPAAIPGLSGPSCRPARSSFPRGASGLRTARQVVVERPALDPLHLQCRPEVDAPEGLARLVVQGQVQDAAVLDRRLEFKLTEAPLDLHRLGGVGFLAAA